MSDYEKGPSGIFRAAALDLYLVRNYIYLAVGVFLLGIASGLVFPARFEPLFESFRDFALSFKGRSAGVMIAMIFLKNLTASLSSLMLGLLFGVVPLFSCVVNGILIGEVLVRPGGPGFLEFIVRLMPHGIFELPAVFISWGLGIWLGTWWFRKDRMPVRERLKRALRVFFVIVFPLLVVAAIIEGFSIAGIS